MPGGLSGAPWLPARDPKISDLSADRLLSRQYEVSGAFEHARKSRSVDHSSRLMKFYPDIIACAPNNSTQHRLPVHLEVEVRL